MNIEQIQSKALVKLSIVILREQSRVLQAFRPGGEVLPYMGYIGMCSPKRVGFSTILVINRASNLVDFGHSGHK